MKSEKKFIVRIIILVVVGLMFVAYGKYITKVVREDTIKSAELVEVTDDGYIIDFDGETHSYNFNN